MATVKSFTDLQQSHKLAEILPIESADMWWAWYSSPCDNGHYDDFPMFYKPICNPDESIPCWSLSVLVSVLPNENMLVKTTDGEYYWLAKDVITKHYNNPIDACVDMIIKLKELNLL